MLGFEAVRSVSVALAAAAVVDAHVAGPVAGAAAVPFPFELEGVRMGRGWVCRGEICAALNHEGFLDGATILVSRNKLSNLATLYAGFSDASSLSNGMPSTRVILPRRSRSATMSSSSRA